MRSLSCLALFAMCLPALPAAASTAVLLPRAGGAGVGAQARDEALAELERVLENEGWQVYGLGDVSAGLPARLSACGPEDRCAWELAQHLSTDVAIGLRLWGTEDQIERLAVVIVAHGIGHRAIATVDETLPLPFAIAEAARGALRVWAATDDGFRPPPGETTASDVESGQIEPSPMNWALGTLLVLGSAPMLGFGINSAVRSGDCVTEGPRGSCVERVRFQEGAAIFTVVGSVMLVAGIVVYITQPLRVVVHADSTSAGLELIGRF